MSHAIATTASLLPHTLSVYILPSHVFLFVLYMPSASCHVPHIQACLHCPSFLTHCLQSHSSSLDSCLTSWLICASFLPLSLALTLQHCMPPIVLFSSWVHTLLPSPWFTVFFFSSYTPPHTHLLVTLHCTTHTHHTPCPVPTTYLPTHLRTAHFHCMNLQHTARAHTALNCAANTPRQTFHGRTPLRCPSVPRMASACALHLACCHRARRTGSTFLCASFSCCCAL